MCRANEWRPIGNWCACIHNSRMRQRQAQNEIHALVTVLFPEFTQIFADPCLPAALRVLHAYPSASAIATAGVEAIVQALATPSQPPTRYGRPSAQKLVELAHKTVSSGQAVAGRSVSLRILCGQLQHTRTNLARLQVEIEQLLADDPQVKGLQQIPEFGTKTVAVLRAELGDVQRFACIDEVIAYGGMDIEIKESGLWKGKAKLSKRGSGPTRDGCCIWPLYAAFTWRIPLLEPTTIVWSSAVSKKARH
jgi:transposase